MTLDPMLEWKYLDEAHFDRVVEALLVRHHRDEAGIRVYALDGRGGDEGLDVVVEREGVIEHVYQLKFFPEGFSGGFSKSRRPQIKKSFETAMAKHQPLLWTLVIPGNGTLSERKHVSTLRGRRTVIVGFMGRAELDGLLAAYPEIAAWASRKPVLDELRSFQQEKAALATPYDLLERVQSLAKRVDERSPFWGVGFSAHGNQVEQWVYAKRPDAPEKEPLELQLKTQFGPEHEELRQRFVSFLDWGTVEPLTLPPEVATRVIQRGPEWFAEEHINVFFEIRPESLAKGRAIELRVVRDGILLASLRGEGTISAPGRVGGTLHTEFRRCLTMDWRVPADGLTGSVNVSFSLERAENASDASAVIRFLRAMHPDHTMELWVNGTRAFESQSGDALPLAPDEVIASWVDDLAYLERELGVTVEIPEETTTRDRVLLRIARMILEGRCAIWPVASSFTGEATGDLDDTVRMVLSGQFAMGMTTDAYAVEIAGHSFSVGEAQLFHPRAEVVDAATHLAALEAGDGRGRKIETRPSDGTPFRVYSPSRWRARWQDPKKPLIPEPWNVPGVPEHSKLKVMRGESAT